MLSLLKAKIEPLHQARQTYGIEAPPTGGALGAASMMAIGDGVGTTRRKENPD
jgi:hypothetical protein